MSILNYLPAASVQSLNKLCSTKQMRLLLGSVSKGIYLLTPGRRVIYISYEKVSQPADHHVGESTPTPAFSRTG